MTRARPRAVGFDFGRTLVEIGYPAEGLRQVGPELVAELGLRATPVTPSEVGPAIDSLVDRLIAERHRRDPLHEVDIRAVYREALSSVLQMEATSSQAELASLLLQRPWSAVVRPLPGVLEALDHLRADGARLGLLSNAPYPPSALHGMLDDSGLSARLDAVLFSCELGIRKPAPAAFEALLRGLDTEPPAAWFVGDEWESDILGAAGAGLRPLLAPGSPEPPDAGSVTRLRSFSHLVELWHSEAGAPEVNASPH